MFVIVDQDDRAILIPGITNRFKTMDVAIDVLLVCVGDPVGYAVIDEDDYLSDD